MKYICYQTLDVAVSLAKVADLDRNLGNEAAAVSGFEEAIKLLETLKINSTDDVGLEQKVGKMIGYWSLLLGCF